jgi:rhodanese-related sulfurtransferase
MKINGNLIRSNFMSENKAEKVISDVKETITKPLPTPPAATPKSSAQALKERLQWGEPGLTIIDARDRESYLEERITGAMLMETVENLSKDREIYVYSSNDGEAETVANKIRQEGFESVSQLQGGLAGWKAIQGPTEGRAV